MHVIGESEVLRDVHAGRFDLLNHVIGVPKSGADHDPLPRKLIRADRSLESPQMMTIDCRPDMATDCISRTTAVLHDEILDPFDRAAGPGDHHEIRTLEGSRRFSQPTIRKQISIQPGSHGVDKNDVEITVKPSVLEPVIENQHVE